MAGSSVPARGSIWGDSPRAGALASTNGSRHDPAEANLRLWAVPSIETAHMHKSELKERFKKVKKPLRNPNALDILGEAGGFTCEVLEMLAREYRHVPISWGGKGSKAYTVYVAQSQKQPFSRAANIELFLRTSAEFKPVWKRFTDGLNAGKASGKCVWTGDPTDINKAIYTAVIAFASAIDLQFPGDRGSPGSFFETIVGASISHVTGLDENGEVKLDIPSDASSIVVKSDAADSPAEAEVLDDSALESDEGEIEDSAVIKTDRWFQGKSRNLVVALKISSRERISQVSVQQLILEKIAPGKFQSILCACNENNVMPPKNVPKDFRPYDHCTLKDTLVPKTIALYHRFVTPYAGLYYLDPPVPYVDGTYSGMPPIKSFHALLAGDLPILLGL